MDLLGIINECIQEDKEKDDMTDIGFKLFMAAKEYRKKAENVGEVEPTEEELKINSLRGAEKEGNLAWMNNSSWYRLPIDFRENFLNVIEPLVWSGVYFKNSDFETNLDVVLSKLNKNCSIAIIRDSKNYRFVSVTTTAREFDSMSEKDFSRYCKDFRARLIKVYGYSSTGVTCSVGD